MRGSSSLMVLLVTLVFGPSAANAQSAERNWPESPSKQRFVATCGGCHDINRIRVGYSPEGWLTVVRMMQNMQAPVPLKSGAD
jgi:virginiamycin B lyase